MGRRCLITLLASGVALGPLAAQVCRLSIAGLNRNRRVTGPIHTECPGDPFHSAPFGNWGVTSNFGGKINGHQFDGWCHNARVCDNNNNCFDVCRDGWYEWNSCTDVAEFKAPNCTLYNDLECTQQRTTQDINVMSTQSVDLAVRCPLDVNYDGIADEGGCADLRQYSHGTNFMSLYELDPLTPDTLVQTLYFPETPVVLNCAPLGCPPAGSTWVAPNAYADPASPPKVLSEMAMLVNSGTFVNVNGVCPAVQSLLQSTSAASFRGSTAAPESLVAGFARGLTTVTVAATSQPLPATLAGITVRIRDKAGGERLAPLLFVSPSQVNYLVPAGTARGTATVDVLSGSLAVATGSLEIAAVAPALFSANANGAGVAAALALRVSADGTRTIEPVFRCAATCTPQPIDTASGDVYLLLFGTGIRGRSGAATVTIGAVPAEVLYAGPQPEYAGLDQVNVRVPPTLAGGGVVDLVLTVDGAAANVVTIAFR